MARSPLYEWRLPAGPGEWRAAHTELLRRWVSQGEPLRPLEEAAPLSPDDTGLRIHQTLRVYLDDVWYLEHEVPLRRGVAGERADEVSGADAPGRWSAGLPELWSPTEETP